MPDTVFEPDCATPFTCYLQEIDLLLCDLPQQRRKEIKQELIAHLEDAARESQISPADQRLQQAVMAALGSSFELGVALYEANTPKILTAKRLIDITVSLLLLTLYSPLLIIISIIVKLDSPGPILFRDARQGKHGKPILVYKFRTMFPANDQRQPLRVTRFGRILRKTFLDEFPQLLNVLKGNLSLVGPCPLSQNYGEIDNSLRCRLQAVKPGFCTPGHVKYGFVHVSMETQMAEDAHYINHQSLRYDLSIVQKLVTGIFRDQRYKK
jgi:lipopolysaccharide/colanic/teichoic acid biosynthesis glycosyltransferase